MSEEALGLFPNNLESILAKIDSVRAPKSEGLVFVRVWVNESQNFERLEVLASTNTELATWVKQYVPSITWTSKAATDSWYDLRLEFLPIPYASLPMVEGMIPKRLDSWVPALPTITSPLVEYTPYQLPYISLDDSELRRISYQMDSPDLFAKNPKYVKLSLLPVSERIYPYVALETEELGALKAISFSDLLLNDKVTAPSLILLDIKPLQLTYIPLDCEGLSFIKKELVFTQAPIGNLDYSEIPIFKTAEQILLYIPLETEKIVSMTVREYPKRSNLRLKLSPPATILIEAKPYQPSYIALETDGLLPIKSIMLPAVKLVVKPEAPSVTFLDVSPYLLGYIALDCSELSPFTREITQSSLFDALSPVISRVEDLSVSVSGWNLPYIAIDSDELDFVAKLITNESSIVEFVSTEVPDWRAPEFVINEIFDPIDTKGLEPLIKSYNGLSAPRIHAPIFKVELPEFRFRTYLDTEELSPVNLKLSPTAILNPQLAQNFDWRPEIPVSQFDLEREVSIPCMPEIAIFPQNMQDILDQIPYPETARKLELEGEVRFRIWLDDEGRYLKHEVMESLPYLTRLCESLLPDVEYLPVLLHSNPVPFQTEITFYFDMNRGNPSQCHYQDTRVTDDDFSY